MVKIGHLLFGSIERSREWVNQYIYSLAFSKSLVYNELNLFKIFIRKLMQKFFKDFKSTSKFLSHSGNLLCLLNYDTSFVSNGINM